MEEILKKLIVVFVILISFLIVSRCNNNSVNYIKADYFNIGYGQSWYEGNNKVDNETVQSLVKAYNQIEYSQQTNEEIDYNKAITIQFIYNDQISGILVINDKGIFHLRNSSGNYQIDANNNIYENALEIYKEVKKQY